MKAKHIASSIGASLVIALAACGGGSNGTSSGGPVGPLSAADPGSVSTGSISAFGSVFVNGHEFSTAHARVVDDDSGAASSSTSGLEVGMVVDVIAAADSTSAVPAASELHLHPLARGFVDASDTTAATVKVMGQTVQLTAATNYSDHRACVSATTSPCTAITGQGDLVPTAGTDAGAVAGSYVTVHGYLFTGGSGAANIVATLVSVRDAPGGSAAGVNFKAEGVVTATSASSITIGGMTVDLSHADCHAAGATVGCATAFSAGQVVSAFAAAAPSLPATVLLADLARMRSKVVADTAGATVEIEGAVSSVTTTSPASFVVRGINVDASALPAGSNLPAVGDIVRVLGTLGSTGQSVTTGSVTVVHAARSATFGLEGDASGVTARSVANTYVLTILGQNVTVTATTRLADRSTTNWDHSDPASNPFNIATFQTYLAASKSQHLLVKAAADAGGTLTALSVTILPASTTAGIAGIVDASPAPVNSSVTGTPSTFAVHGVKISADPAAVLGARPGGGAAAVAAGDDVVALGTLTDGTVVVAATPSRSNVVVDFGVPRRPDHDGF
jgi:hypothetical protein